MTIIKVHKPVSSKGPSLSTKNENCNQIIIAITQANLFNSENIIIL
jgi:hypothetical protein